MSDTTTTHASESTHWYTQEGQPAYTQTAKAGHERPTTLRDARKLGLVPSVTTVIKAAAAPALEAWKRNQAMLAALTLPREEGENDDQWLARIVEDSKQHAKNAAELGTEIHAALQGSFEGEVAPDEYKPHIKAVKDELNAWTLGVPDHEWGSEAAFAHPLGFGGKCDLSTTAVWDGLVADYKSKEFSPDDKLAAYDNQSMQLAAYRVGLGLPKARCSIIYVSVTHPGHAQLVEILEDELMRGWRMFRALLEYWSEQKRFEPGF